MSFSPFVLKSESSTTGLLFPVFPGDVFANESVSQLFGAINQMDQLVGGRRVVSMYLRKKVICAAIFVRSPWR